MVDQVIKMHILRAPPRVLPLLTPAEEQELEKDLVPAERWGPAIIQPRHRREPR